MLAKSTKVYIFETGREERYCMDKRCKLNDLFCRKKTISVGWKKAM